MTTDPTRGDVSNDVYDEVIISPSAPAAAAPAVGTSAGTLPGTPPGTSLADPSAGAPAVERRVNRVDDASMLDDDAAIDPRELDAMVRIEEGATVDDGAPVAGVRYEGDEATPHRYGQPDDAYGPGHGDGRIGFDKVVGDVAPDAG